MPDYLPVIGPSSADKRVIYAFGHQHLGITLGGATGELVAQLVDGKRTTVLERFSAAGSASTSHGLAASGGCTETEFDPPDRRGPPIRRLDHQKLDTSAAPL
jgi:hypothetical protein